MGKSLAGADQAGLSAQVEYRRARRSARRHRVTSTAAMTLAAALGLAAVAGIPLRGARGLLAALAVGVVLLAWHLRPDRDIERWRRGAAGEQATAGLLAGLPRRFVVLHDRRVPGSRANIDHLVIGPTGVWVVDSKAYRAPIRVRRGVVWAGEHEVPTSTAAWEAERVAALLGVPHVAAVVAVHGSGLRPRGVWLAGVRVIPAERLCRRLRRGPRVMSRSAVGSVAAAADHALPPRTLTTYRRRSLR